MGSRQERTVHSAGPGGGGGETVPLQQAQILQISRNVGTRHGGSEKGRGQLPVIIALPTQPSNIPMEEFGGICNNRKSSNDIVKPRHCYTDLHINNSIYLTQTFQELSQGLNGIQTNETY